MDRELLRNHRRGDRGAFFIIKKLAILFLCTLLVVGVAIGLLYLLHLWEEKSRASKGFLYDLWNVVDGIPVLRDLPKIAPLIVAPYDLYKKTLRKRSLIAGSIILALIMINVENPILGVFKLPPAKHTAAYVFYSMLAEEMAPAPDSLGTAEPVLDYVVEKYHLYPDPLSGDGMGNAMVGVWTSRMQENPLLEFYGEYGLDGMSQMEYLMETRADIRSQEGFAEKIKEAPEAVDIPGMLTT
jgi:hypothetical protein